MVAITALTPVGTGAVFAFVAAAAAVAAATVGAFTGLGLAFIAVVAAATAALWSAIAFRVFRSLSVKGFPAFARAMASWARVRSEGVNGSRRRRSIMRTTARAMAAITAMTIPYWASWFIIVYRIFFFYSRVLMNIVALVLLVATVVLGAFGVVFVIESVKREPGDRKRPAAYAVASFFAAIVLGLAATYVSHVRAHKGYTYADYIWSAPSASGRVRTGDAMMTAMISSQSTAGTIA